MIASVVTSLFVVAFEDEMVLVSTSVPLLLDCKYVDVKVVNMERPKLIKVLITVDDCSSYELEVDVSILEVEDVNESRMYGEVVFAVACDIDVSD
jgi:hypothetical protein